MQWDVEKDKGQLLVYARCMGHCTVLCYHSVSDDWEHPLAVTRSAFESQLTALLGRGFGPVPAARVLEAPARALYVTFDDAFRDVLDVVPVLRRLGVEATVFASTGFAEGGSVFAVPELADEAAVNGDRMRTMSWDELRGLVADGFDVGSHTITHPHLAELDDDELERELRDSRARLEDELGRPCRFLAYPYGESDARVQATARRAGYEAAFSLGVSPDPGNRYAYPRVDFYRRDNRLRARLKTSILKPHASSALMRVRRIVRAW